jgi:protein-S-isoprenylcysteine O-methyltransferase Ste14
LHVRAAVGLLQLPIAMAALLLLPAGTLRYWQAWTFIAVFFVCSLAMTLYLAVKDPKLLERRMNVGPAAEKEKAQKLIVAVVAASFAATMVVPAIDHRLGWSVVPTFVVLLGDVLIVVAFLAFLRVFRENTYGASTIQVAEGQYVISTGPYAIVRHPLYSAALILLLGIPLALGSWWGLLTLPFSVAAICWRLLDEERFLRANLRGYADYMNKVRYRLLPSLW